MEIKNFGMLIRGITSNANYYIGKKIEKYGVKQGQFEYFLLIYSTPGINQLELAKLKNVGKASVTKALKILEEDDFIIRVTDENDRRNTLCYITEKGEKIVNDLLDIKTNAEDYMFMDFNNDDKEKLFTYLTLLFSNSKKLVESLDDIDEDK